MITLTSHYLCKNGKSVDIKIEPVVLTKAGWLDGRYKVNKGYEFRPTEITKFYDRKFLERVSSPLLFPK